MTPAHFKAADTFIIRGRGLVLSGWVIDGILRSGMVVAIPEFPRRLAIDGFERINTQGQIKDILGLLFLSTDPQEIALWKSLDLKDKILEIESAES